MNISRSKDRVRVLDERSRFLLITVTWLGGYVTAEQAQELGIRDSVPRVHVQLKDLESCGFIKRISSYPAVYQVTKSVARIMGADFSARRQHANQTIRTRILTVNFYLEALGWPVDFVFNHGRKLSKFGELGCEASLLPQRGGKPYLWQDFVLQRRSGGLAVAMVEHFGRSAYRQLYRFLKRFARCLGVLQDKLRLLVVVGSDARLRLFTRLLMSVLTAVIWAFGINALLGSATRPVNVALVDCATTAAGKSIRARHKTHTWRVCMRHSPNVNFFRLS